MSLEHFEVRLEVIGEQWIGREVTSNNIWDMLDELGRQLDIGRTHKWSIFWDDFPEEVNVFTDDGYEAFDIKVADGEVAHINFNAPVLWDLIPDMKCPMCETGDMEHRAVDNPQAMNEEKATHMWVCEQCPAILVEWYDTSDTEAFARGIR